MPLCPFMRSFDARPIKPFLERPGEGGSYGLRMLSSVTTIHESFTVHHTFLVWNIILEASRVSRVLHQSRLTLTLKVMHCHLTETTDSLVKSRSMIFTFLFALSHRRSCLFFLSLSSRILNDQKNPVTSSEPLRLSFAELLTLFEGWRRDWTDLNRHCQCMEWWLGQISSSHGRVYHKIRTTQWKFGARFSHVLTSTRHPLNWLPHELWVRIELICCLVESLGQAGEAVMTESWLWWSASHRGKPLTAKEKQRWFRCGRPVTASGRAGISAWPWISCIDSNDSTMRLSSPSL